MKHGMDKNWPIISSEYKFTAASLPSPVSHCDETVSTRIYFYAVLEREYYYRKKLSAPSSLERLHQLIPVTSIIAKYRRSLNHTDS
jgi:hypothetical protein